MANTMLPILKPQFFDSDGAPLAGGYVAFYEAGTTDYKDVFGSYGSAIALTNPVPLDSAGMASIWLDGTIYDVAVYDGVNADPTIGDYGTLLYTIDNVFSCGTLTLDATLPWVDATNDTNLNGTIDAIGSTDTEVWITSQQTLTDNLTIPANVHLRFTRDGIIVSDGYTLTIEGTIEAGLFQIFTGFSAGNVTFSYAATVYPQWWGAIGNGTTTDTTALNTCLQAANTSGSPVYLGGRDITYLTDAEISITMPAESPSCLHIYGDGAKILNTTTNVLTITGPYTGQMLLEGFQIIGSSDDYVTRNSHDGLTIDDAYDCTVRRMTFGGFNYGLKPKGALWLKVDDCRFKYCNHHCYCDNDSASVNVSEFTKNKFWFGMTAGDVGTKTLSTDTGLTVLTAACVRVTQNTFEFPQTHGMWLNRNQVAVVESNYFEHGTDGVDILIQGTEEYNHYCRISQNYHYAGSGNGGTSSGHAPYSSVTHKTILLGNLVNGYHADNVDSDYVEGTAVIGCDSLQLEYLSLLGRTDESTLDMMYSTVDLKKESVFSRRKTIAGTTTSDMFKITGSDESHIAVEITAYNGRNTTGANGGVIKAYATLYCTSTTISFTNAITQSNTVGTGFTWSTSVSGREATFKCANGTGNDHWVAYEVKVLNADTLESIRVTITEL